MPHIVDVIENIDLATLDQGHVIPNMGPPNIRASGTHSGTIVLCETELSTCDNVLYHTLPEQANRL